MSLYDALAGDYEAHFAVPHRRAYDDLAWEFCTAALPSGGTVVDVGCGIGRWAARLLGTYEVIGIEPSAAMADRAARLGFRLIRSGVEDVSLEPVDAVVAMGSLQYAADPVAAIARCAGWLRPGGVLAVLVDSRIALVRELLAAGRTDEALERLHTRRGLWRVGTQEASMHLFDAAELRGAVEQAGLAVERLSGLLVGASVPELTRRLEADHGAALAEQRRLADEPSLADLGKQLLVIARRPAR